MESAPSRFPDSTVTVLTLVLVMLFVVLEYLFDWPIHIPR